MGATKRTGQIKSFKVPRLRLLPIVIIMAVFMLSVRLGGLWQDVAVNGTNVFVGLSQAQAQAQGEGVGPAEQGRVGVQNGQTASDQVAQATQEPANEDEDDRASGVTTGIKITSDPLKDPMTFTQSEIDLLQRLAERRELLEQRAGELDQREALLKAAEGRIDRKIAELQTLEESINGLLKKHDDQELEKINQLVKIYATMKPKDAARIFNDLDMPILITVMENMKEAKSAPILAAMESKKARSLTEELSRRRQIPLPNGAGGG